jgi:hypothetical protein
VSGKKRLAATSSARDCTGVVERESGRFGKQYQWRIEIGVPVDDATRNTRISDATRRNAAYLVRREWLEMGRGCSKQETLDAALAL